MEYGHEWNARPSGGRPSAGAVIVLAIMFGVVAGFGGAVLALWAHQTGKLAFLPQPTAIAGAASPAAGTIPTAVMSGAQSFANVAEEMNDSVVNVDVTTVQSNPFDIFGFGAPREVAGKGTGVIMTADGYILTNNHVVGEAQDIRVTILGKDGKQTFQAKLIGGDKQEDLALLKIDATGLHPAKFGDSDKVKPGEWVMAIGNPYGFEHTVSVGVVSALNRLLPVDDTVRMKGMIQTDASINPGNSGGPLVNQLGEVIGINTAVFLGNGGGEPRASNIGFAIPSNRAKHIVEQLRTTGKVSHPYVGIVFGDIDDQVRRQRHLPMKQGLLVVGVYEKGPAASAGMRENDIIVTVDGTPMRDKEALSNYIGKKTVGDTLQFVVKRWEENTGEWVDKTVDVKLAEMPAEFMSSMNRQQRQRAQPEQPDQGGRVPFPFPFP